jgi:hypothetical protein
MIAAVSTVPQSARPAGESGSPMPETLSYKFFNKLLATGPNAPSSESRPWQERAQLGRPFIQLVEAVRVRAWSSPPPASQALIES